jgi:hypothetical protein
MRNRHLLADTPDRSGRIQRPERLFDDAHPYLGRQTGGAPASPMMTRVVLATELMMVVH